MSRLTQNSPSPQHLENSDEQLYPAFQGVRLGSLAVSSRVAQGAPSEAHSKAHPELRLKRPCSASTVPGNTGLPTRARWTSSQTKGQEKLGIRFTVLDKLRSTLATNQRLAELGKHDHSITTLLGSRMPQQLEKSRPSSNSAQCEGVTFRPSLPMVEHVACKSCCFVYR